MITEIKLRNMGNYIRKVSGVTVISQAPNLRLNSTEEMNSFLSILVGIMIAIERETGFRWKVTSWLRNSPSHQYGVSLDIAPDIDEQVSAEYAVNKGSDPVLYKRTALIRGLQRVAKKYCVPDYCAGIYIEPDHLHIQLHDPAVRPNEIRVFKWKQPKPVYPDTNERMQLGMLP
jgi:hypothetical protein